jgi:hypothetical protein
VSPPFDFLHIGIVMMVASTDWMRNLQLSTSVRTPWFNVRLRNHPMWANIRLKGRALPPM